jgi:ParB family chromosome partitioning protein
MDFEVAPVLIDQINTGDHTFKITTKTEPAELARSINLIGLLQPPVLVKTGSDFTIVCGYRRIDACKTLNIRKIPARRLLSTVSTATCAQIAVIDNSSQRALNIVEQSRAYALIRKFADDEAAWMKIVESTGLASSQAAMDRILPVADMPASLQDAILERSIALPIALQIIHLKSDDATALCRFFRQVATGLNLQRELLALIVEISRRDDTPIAGLLAQSSIADILYHPDMPAPERTQRLRMMLTSTRFPELSKAEAAYNQKVKALKLNPMVQLHPPRFFEGTNYRLSLTVDSRRQLKTLQSELDKLVHHPSLLPE